MNSKSQKINFIFIAVEVVSFLFVQITFAVPEERYTSSPSFVRQEVIDSIHDWHVWKQQQQNGYSNVHTHRNATVILNTADNISECNVNGSFFSPDIQSVSYQSDGRFFNATLWLTEPFGGPASSDNLNHYQEQIEIIIKNNLTLEQYYNIQKSAFSQITNDKIEVNKTLSHLPANEINYSIIDASQNTLRKMDIWTEYKHTIYELIYTALDSVFDQNYKEYANEVINSFKLMGSAKNLDYRDTENYTAFNNTQISILYPNNWNIKEFTNAELKFSRYNISPNLGNSEKPIWQEIFFTSSFDVKSVHDTGTDYSITLTQTPFQFFNKDWFKQERELSAYSQIRILKQQQIENPFSSEFSYFIPISVDLKDLNYPPLYNVIFSMSNNFVINDKLCKLVDTTNWMIIPPPEYKTITIPTNLQLSPGQTKNVFIKIVGNNKTDLSQKADFVFLANSSDSDLVRHDLRVIFSPNHTTILPSSIGSTLMSVSVSGDTSIRESKTVDVPISVDVSFPNSTKNKKGEEFFNNKSISVAKVLDYVVTVSPPPTTAEQFNNFVSQWINPLNNVWTFVFGISSAAASVILFKLEKIKRHKQESDC